MAKAKQDYKLANEVAGVLLIALGLILCLAVFLRENALILLWLRSFLFGVFGVAGYVVPFLLMAGGVLCIARRKDKPQALKVVLGALGVLCAFSIVHLCYTHTLDFDAPYLEFIGQSYASGRLSGSGVLGALLSYPVHAMLGTAGGIIVFAAVAIVSFMVVLNFSLRRAGEALSETVKDKRVKLEETRKVQRAQQAERRSDRVVERAFSYHEPARPAKGKRLYIEEVHSQEQEEESLNIIGKQLKGKFEAQSRVAEQPQKLEWTPMPKQPLQPEQEDEEDVPPAVYELDCTYPEEEHWEYRVPEPPEVVEELPLDQPEEPALPEKFLEEPISQARQEEPAPRPAYVKPPIELLNENAEGAGSKAGRDEVRINAERLEETLKSFSVVAKVTGVSRGPRVTRYELQPAPGVKISKIVGLTDDIALNLAARGGIRMEAPIPGKAAIGIEIPNAEDARVTARDLLDTDEFRRQKSVLAFALGKDISGKNVYADLVKMPHLLVAGTTGSGKSVCLNTIIMSLLYNSTPEEVQLIMIDPKMVEMAKYNGIPNLKIPVVTDPQKAAGALAWAVAEMINRYKAFSAVGVKDIERYNAGAAQRGEQKLPKLVIIIDEFADLMMVSATDVEDAVCRIAQLGRASGIHLVIATQSPRADIFTGLIKANVPSRIALTVSNGLESRIILDATGAEKLLGYGDMLFAPVGTSKPTRIQGCFIADDELERVTDFLKEHCEAEYDEETDSQIQSMIPAKEKGKGTADAMEVPDDEDALIPAAIELALEYEQLSISMLQRRLRVGYARAARLVDILEQRRIVSPADGSKPRNVLITWEEYHSLYGDRGDIPHE